MISKGGAVHFIKMKDALNKPHYENIPIIVSDDLKNFKFYSFLLPLKLLFTLKTNKTVPSLEVKLQTISPQNVIDLI